jgi:hypothetical protein
MSPHRWPRLLTTCCIFTLCVVRKTSAIWSTVQSWAFLAPEWEVQVQRWSQRESTWNFLQPQPESGTSVRNGIWAPTDVAKKVCQRLADQDSSLWWGLILPSQLIGLNHKTRLGSSSSFFYFGDAREWMRVFFIKGGSSIIIALGFSIIVVEDTVWVLSGGKDELLQAKTELFSATRDHKDPLDVFKRMTQTDDLLGDSILTGDGEHVGSVLSPHKEYVISICICIYIWGMTVNIGCDCCLLIDKARAKDKICIYHTFIGFFFCLLWIDKARAKDKRYIWVPVWWKTTN